jgi:hypothetical protein
MENLLFFLIAGYGLTNIVVKSDIAYRFREMFKKIPFFYNLFNCVTCFGFWAGVGLSFYFEYNCFFAGFAISGISTILNKEL